MVLALVLACSTNVANSVTFLNYIFPDFVLAHWFELEEFNLKELEHYCSNSSANYLLLLLIITLFQVCIMLCKLLKKLGRDLCEYARLVVGRSPEKMAFPQLWYLVRIWEKWRQILFYFRSNQLFLNQAHTQPHHYWWKKAQRILFFSQTSMHLVISRFMPF